MDDVSFNISIQIIILNTVDLDKFVIGPQSIIVTGLGAAVRAGAHVSCATRQESVRLFV